MVRDLLSYEGELSGDNQLISLPKQGVEGLGRKLLNSCDLNGAIKSCDCHSFNRICL
jgi:hypothetical protein